MACIGATGDCVVEGVIIGIVSGHRGYRRLVLGNTHTGRVTSAIAGDLGCIVGIGHRHGDGLRVGQGAVRHRHLHLIDIVASPRTGVFKIRRRYKGECAIAVNRELACIGATGDCVGQCCFWVYIRCGNCSALRLVLGGAHIGRITTANNGCIVD